MIHMAEAVYIWAEISAKLAERRTMLVPRDAPVTMAILP